MRVSISQCRRATCVWCVVVSTATVFSQRGHARKAMHRGMHECARACTAGCMRACGFPSRPVAPSLAAHSPLFTLCSLLI